MRSNRPREDLSVSYSDPGSSLKFLLSQSSNVQTSKFIVFHSLCCRVADRLAQRLNTRIHPHAAKHIHNLSLTYFLSSSNKPTISNLQPLSIDRPRPLITPPHPHHHRPFRKSDGVHMLHTTYYERIIIQQSNMSLANIS